MTMLDGKCDVCGIRPPIGVASTHIPLSVAYCVECATAGADPESVFEYWASENLSPDEMACPDDFCTWKDGKYVSYRHWWDQRE
jgi:hypothetical protein